MKELVIISGKGGTGKTSITAAFATLASRAATVVYADCDVDAADLHLIFSPTIKQQHEFISGYEAVIDEKMCLGCGICAQLCRFDAVHQTQDGNYAIAGCEGCGVCVDYCPAHAMRLVDCHCGQWYVSETRFGTLIHAELASEAENSGKLVTIVRKEAQFQAKEQQADYIIIDGSPGIGCPVIASITQADLVVAVAQPSLSSKHDLERVMQLARYFAIPMTVIINKSDINESITREIQAACKSAGIPVAGTICYDAEITTAQLHAQSIIEYNELSPAALQIAAAWEHIHKG